MGFRWWLFLSLCISQSSLAFSRTDCPVAKVQNIQIEHNIILYRQEGFAWRKLGNIEDIGTKERYAALLAAQMSGKKVMISYSVTGFDCHSTNFQQSAFIVRTYVN